jgi:uncharacterized protein YndB with AHSA1/START domain
MAKTIYPALFIILTTFIQSARGQQGTTRGYKREEGIQWPVNYDPSKSKFFIHNEIDIKASPETVWSILIAAEQWPEWYEGAENVKLENALNGNLIDSTVIYWKTMGLKMSSKIRDFTPARYLSWESSAKSIRGFHVWLIKPTENGCIVVTEESQLGWLTFFEKIFQPKKLFRLHDKWLTGLKQKAETK